MSGRKEDETSRRKERRISPRNITFNPRRTDSKDFKDPSPKLTQLLKKQQVTLAEFRQIADVSVKAEKGRVYVVQAVKHWQDGPYRCRIVFRSTQVNGIETCSHCKGSGWLSGPNKPGCHSCKMTGFKGWPK